MDPKLFPVLIISALIIGTAVNIGLTAKRHLEETTTEKNAQICAIDPSYCQ